MRVTIRDQKVAVLIAVLVLAALGLVIRAPALADMDLWADFDGHRVFYQETGQGEPTVVFLHGWTCDHTFWRLQIPAVSREYRVLALDFIGHGQSDKPRVDYTQDFFVKGVEAVIDAAGVDQVVLVGHSMGASVARLYALKHPAKIKGFIIVDGAFNEVPDDEAGRQAFRESFRAFALSVQGPDWKEKNTAFIESMFTAATPPEIRREILERVNSVPRYVADSAMLGFGDPDIWKEEPITVPTLAVYAENPELNEGFAAYLKRNFPRIDFRVWPGLGHFFMFEKPDELSRVMLDFLKTLD